MDRQIVYVAAIPLDTDFLGQARNVEIARGRSAEMLYGAGILAVGGFACTPGTGLSVLVAPGTVLAPGTIDDTAYGSLPADASPITRQYIAKDATTLALTAGATWSVFVSAARSDEVGTVVPYYNAANPAQTLTGPGNDGLAQPSVRQDRATVSIGTSVPGGATLLWTVTVPAGATTITQAMIAQAPSAPFMATIPQLMQGRRLGAPTILYGSASAQTLTIPPGCNNVRIRAAAHGGPGGSTPACSSTEGAAAGGGSGGATAEIWYPASTLAGAAIMVPQAQASVAYNGSHAAAVPLTITSAGGTLLLSLPGGLPGGDGLAAVSSAGGSGPASDQAVTISDGLTIAFSSGMSGQIGIALSATTPFTGQGGAGGGAEGFGGGGRATGGNTSGTGGGIGGGGSGACTGPSGGAYNGGPGGEGRLVAEFWT